ncbi:hypothetical protein BLS_004801 [Venturia inaequalis]|uniref:Uncharacterized protein n=1 Tax=Venturia inaequalis TaxID=5025 RepID=A0A8H3UK54_VENIN|nr:hypothetical protein EG328_009827 [Venturia inaequalis]KAE9970668.1 hypothetical protein BLS_004801 [Venturia inaequalis]RDI76661.1 Uncharacterized protein Vi05172_g13367 [Venturia inaequalis]
MPPKDIIDAYLESLSISDDQLYNPSHPAHAARLRQLKERVGGSQPRMWAPSFDGRGTEVVDDGTSQLNSTLPPLDERVTEVLDDTEPRSFFANVRIALETARNASGTPIEVLKLQIAANISDTLPIAAYLASTMTAAIEGNAWTIPLFPKMFQFNADSFADAENIWKSCKFVTIFIMSIAASKAGALQAIKFCSMTRGGLPTLKLIRNTPTSSFRSAFVVAKTAAQKHGKTTVIGVALADVHIFEMAQRGTSDQVFSFAHSFVVSVGPEGFVVWQAWGEHGYNLAEWLKRGGDRVRTWEEAEDFTKDFTKLTAGKGSFDAKRNKLYKKLFDVDLFQICGSKGPERPLVPKFEAWVQLQILEDVKVEDILKFEYE